MNKKRMSLLLSAIISITTLVGFNRSDSIDSEAVSNVPGIDDYIDNDLLGVETLFFEHRGSKEVVASYLYGIMDSLSDYEKNIVLDFITSNSISNDSSVISIPENSSIGFIVASKINNNSVEVDVMFTRDKVPVIFHDDNLIRATGGLVRGSVRDYTYDELSRIKIFYNSSNYTYIPTLDEILTLQSNSTNNLILELKLRFLDKFFDSDIMDTLKLSFNKFGSERVFVMSGDQLFIMNNYSVFKELGIKTGIVLFSNRTLRSMLLNAESDYYDFISLNHSIVNDKIIKHSIMNDKALFIGASGDRSKDVIDILFNEIGIVNNLYIVTEKFSRFSDINEKRLVK